MSSKKPARPESASNLEPPSESAVVRTPSPRGALLAGISLALCVISVAGWFFWKRNSVAAPASTVASDYVDPQVCASCHQDVVATYRKTGMGRSFYRPTKENTVEDYTSRNTLAHKPSGLSYTMVERDGKFFQRRNSTGFDGKETNIVEEQVDYVIGSGNHARTYLHRTQPGMLAELPVSWYAEHSGHWDMSPGYDGPSQEDIRRTITPECLFCHNGYPQLDTTSDQINFANSIVPATLPEGINCQRCHGPGRAHVAAATASHLKPELIRASIVNPQNLPRDRQMEVCMQCHLETSSSHSPNEIRFYDREVISYRPGQPLGDYKIYLDRAGDEKKEDRFEVVEAAYRLRQSKCYLKSEMTCLTCHDPHDIPRGEEATQTYVAVCEKCHQIVKHQLALPVSSNCITCHMPRRRTQDVVHAVMTDHLIQRDKPLRDMLAPIAEIVSPDPGTPVVPYYPPDASKLPRNELYLAVAQVNDGPGMQGIARLQEVLSRESPSKPQPYVALGRAYVRRGNSTEALRWFETAMQHQPNYLPAIRESVLALTDLGQDARALQLLQRTVALYPNDDVLLLNLGNVYLRMNMVSESQKALDRAAAANPEHADVYNLMGLVALRQNDNASAEASFRQAIRWQPDLAEAQSNLGTLLTGKHSLQEAEFHLHQAIKANPNYAEAHHGLGVVLVLQGAVAQAESEMRLATKLPPASAQTHVDLADLLAAGGKTDQAAEEYRQALRLKPEQLDAEMGLGMALLRERKPDEAREHLEKAAASSDQDLRESAMKILSQIGH